MARRRVRFLKSEILKRLDSNRIDTQINLAIFSFQKNLNLCQLASVFLGKLQKMTQKNSFLKT
jgi:hypothetical protein